MKGVRLKQNRILNKIECIIMKVVILGVVEGFFPLLIIRCTHFWLLEVRETIKTIISRFQNVAFFPKQF